jgi:UDP-3-O-[3-hydroxymyristoyl] glucosamine N-acyltransferase
VQALLFLELFLMPEFSVGEIAERVGGDVTGEVFTVIGGVAALDAAGPADLSLVANRKYLSYVGNTGAAAVLVSPQLADVIPEGVTRIVVPDVHAALGQVLALLYPPRPHPPGVHATAVVGADVDLGKDASVGAYAVLEQGSVIGERVRIGPHTVVGEGCRVGADTVLHPHVTLYPGVVLGERCIVHSGARLGSDGFGYTWGDGQHRKVPQVGGCRIDDDVEIGANTTVDRGSIGDTRIGQGTKIDNLVHLAHNVSVGKHAIVVAQVGIAGSSTIGEGAVLGGQAGIGGHLEVGAGARIGAQAGVIGDVAPGETVSGYPARPHREAMRAQGALFRLPLLLRKVQRLERALLAREAQNGHDGDPSTRSS